LGDQLKKIAKFRTLKGYFKPNSLYTEAKIRTRMYEEKDVLGCLRECAGEELLEATEKLQKNNGY
jgi:hypothetical protein